MAEPAVATTEKLDVESLVEGVLDTIERGREREIISRRFGLFDRRETLEQIGELLGITRERVRQLEKAVVQKLKAGADELPNLTDVEQRFISELQQLGSIARIAELTGKVSKDNDRLSQARVSFLATLSPRLSVIDDNDHYHHAVAIKEAHDEKQVKDQVGKIIEAIKNIGEPTSIRKIADAIKAEDHNHVGALASVSKHIASLNERWGLVKWPMVNPKNIRDKIYVILHDNKKPMHFNEIAKAIKVSDFKRKDVTTQAIHNELIKDGRFVLIGRGIYALKEWGYEKGTVADIISEVLKKAGEPLHRDEIVKRVLESRQVKETTILLNLQGKSQFKRVAKATYALADN